MSISFNTISNSLRAPIFTAEFDNSRASQGPALLTYKGLIIGQRTSAGTAAANTFVRVTSAYQAMLAGGRGSQLHRMAIAWFASNKGTEVYLGVLDDNGAGVLATKTITVSGTATAAGTLSVYVGGEIVQVAVASGAANTVVATALEAALDLALDLPVVASVSTNVVTLTALNKGVAGQDLDVRVNYQYGDALPAGITVAIANAVSGITNPVLTTLIANMGDTWYHVIAHPYTDSTSLTALETELASRFGAARMIDGLAVTSAVGSAATLATLGNTRNSPHNCIVAQPGSSPVTQPCEFAAETAALLAKYGSIDPARPFQTLAYSHAKAPAEADLFDYNERNLGLYDGVAASKVVAGGVVTIDRIITTYKTNAGGADDVSYLDANTMLTLMYLRYSWRNRMVSRYPRHKLGSDTARVASGQAIITPLIAKGEALAWFRDMEDLGLVENFEQFKADLVVERNNLDVNRLDFLLSPDLMNQLVVGATKFLFLL